MCPTTGGRSSEGYTPRLGDERLVLHPRNLAARDALFFTGRCEPSGRAPIPSNARAPLNYGPRPRETRRALASNEPAACIGIRQCLRHGCGAAGANVIVRATRGRELLLDGVAEGATPGTAQAEGPRAQQKSGERYGRRAPAYPPKGHTVIRLSTYIYRGCRAATENLSGKRTDGACAARIRALPFFVHPHAAPSR